MSDKIDSDCYCIDKDCEKIDNTNCCGNDECCDESQSDLERREFFNKDESNSDTESDNSSTLSTSSLSSKKSLPIFQNIEKTNDDQIKQKDLSNFVEKKTVQEMIDESKLTTEQELIKLGQIMKENEKKEEEINSKLESNVKIIEKYKNKDIIQLVDDFIKNKKYIELKELFDVLFNHEQIVNNKLKEKDKKIEKLDTQIDNALEDNKELMQENHELEEKIEKYWEPRVLKLREKIIYRNKLMKHYHICYAITIFHTFIFTKYGIFQYFHFWKNLFLMMYRILIFFLYLLPNAYQILTNTNNYLIVYDNIFSYIINIFYIIFEKIYYYLILSNTGIILVITTLIIINGWKRYHRI